MNLHINLRLIKMTDRGYGSPEGTAWPDDFRLPELLSTGTVKEIHATIENKWDMLRRSACQTAAGRALWKHVINDPFAELLAGETYLRSLYEKMRKDRLSNAREVSGVILAVRTLWFDTRLEAALDSFDSEDTQVVLLGAGMDTRAYRLSCLRRSEVFEVDFSEVLQMKTTVIQAATDSAIEPEHLMLTAKSLTRVAADLRHQDWLDELQKSGFAPEKNTVWVLEGILYYLSHTHATQVLQIIAEKAALTDTVLLADIMNKSSTTLPNSIYNFYSDWPEHLLPSLGYSEVKISQLGDPDANFGLMQDPLNLFNKLRSLPRSVETHPVDGTPCCRLYLVQASGQTNHIIS